MAELAQKYKDRLKDLKEMVERSNTYFHENYERFHEFTRFVFQTSLSIQDRQTLQAIGKPDLEFNILESIISRLRGEFAKQQPSLSVRAADGVPLNKLTPEFNKTIEVIEAHMRSIFFDASNDKLEYNTFTDLLAGGFSVLEVYTDYINEKSFEQNICVGRVFDPTLCGFDPLARDSHKGDGKFCYQIYPKTRKQFEDEFGKELADKITYSKTIGGFNWSYRDEAGEVILVCDFYEKKKKKIKILKLTDGNTYTQKEYDSYLENWKNDGNLAQPHQIVNQRMTEIETICRYRLCENEVLDYVETNYKYLPLIFIDGNSVMITESQQQYQMTRPYVYHAQGIQKLKNYAGQTLASELENIVSHKFIVALESIPEDYLAAYQNMQKPNTLIYNHFLDTKSPEITLPPPREIQRTPIPPEVTNTFKMSDEISQVILGTYDNMIGAQGGRQDISGAAIALGAMQTNSASLPYVIGYIKGLNRVGQIILDLIPKYYRTPRSLPILLPTGKRAFEIINKAGSIYMNYDPNSLDIKVETGVNFTMQKEQALKTIIALMQASPGFAQFMNAQGISVLLDNIDIRGIDNLKSKAEKFEQGQTAQQQQAAQAQARIAQMQEQMAQMELKMSMAQKQSEIQMNQAIAHKATKEAQGPSDIELEMSKLEQKNQMEMLKANQEQQKIDISMAELIAKLREMDAEELAKMAEIDAESARTALESLRAIAQIESQQNQGNEKEVEIQLQPDEIMLK